MADAGGEGGGCLKDTQAMIGSLVTEFVGTLLFTYVVFMSKFAQEAAGSDVNAYATMRYTGFNNGLVTFAAYTALIYFGAPISGGHFNPAITLAAMFNKIKFSKEALSLQTVLRPGLYMLMQIAGACVIPIWVYFQNLMVTPYGATQANPGGTTSMQWKYQPFFEDDGEAVRPLIPMLVNEFIWTAFLVLVFLSVGRQSKNGTNGQYHGVAIASVYLATSFQSINRTYKMWMNPATGLAIAVYGQDFFWNFVYTGTGQALAAVVGALLWRLVIGAGDSNENEFARGEKLKEEETSNPV